VHYSGLVELLPSVQVDSLKQPDRRYLLKNIILLKSLFVSPLWHYSCVAGRRDVKDEKRGWVLVAQLSIVYTLHRKTPS